MLGAQWAVVDMRAYPELTVPPETGDTFESNAVIKAHGVSVALPELLVLSDDSGLEVDALGGQPGVRSARYAGEKATDSDNREKLKRELARFGGPFAGRFRCCMAVACGGRVLRTFSGSVEGHLVLNERGDEGFGYDALFVPNGFDQTFGELPAAAKNGLSHRASALTEVIKWLTNHHPST